MPLVKKIFWMPALLLMACAVSGIYGMIHDQLSYTISPDYFHHLKFEQFRISPHLHNRIGVAQVGWFATWWMGLLVGPPLILAGLFIPHPLDYARITTKSFFLAIVTAATIGLLGLAIAVPVHVTKHLPNFSFPAGVQDQEAFLEVGVLHTASYAGGLAGLFVALAYLIYQGFRCRRAAKTVSKPATRPRIPDAKMP